MPATLASALDVVFVEKASLIRRSHLEIEQGLQQPKKCGWLQAIHSVMYILIYMVVCLFLILVWSQKGNFCFAN